MKVGLTEEPELAGVMLFARGATNPAVQRLPCRESLQQVPNRVAGQGGADDSGVPSGHIPCVCRFLGVKM